MPLKPWAMPLGISIRSTYEERAAPLGNVKEARMHTLPQKNEDLCQAEPEAEPDSGVTDDK